MGPMDAVEVADRERDGGAVAPRHPYPGQSARYPHFATFDSNIGPYPPNNTKF
jgi:hypothetical protein